MQSRSQSVTSKPPLNPHFTVTGPALEKPYQLGVSGNNAPFNAELYVVADDLNLTHFHHFTQDPPRRTSAAQPSGAGGGGAPAARPSGDAGGPGRPGRPCGGSGGPDGPIEPYSADPLDQWRQVGNNAEIDLMDIPDVTNIREWQMHAIRAVAGSPPEIQEAQLWIMEAMGPA
eukprot:4477193-Pyramimonas_sp.AAC.1